MRGTVRVVLFATARTAVGQGQFDRPVPEGGVEVRAFLAELTRDFPALRRIIPLSRFVRNGEYLSSVRGRLKPGDEFAIHPPYSGG